MPILSKSLWTVIILEIDMKMFPRPDGRAIDYYLNLAPNEPQIYKAAETRITTDFLHG